MDDPPIPAQDIDHLGSRFGRVIHGFLLGYRFGIKAGNANTAPHPNW
jgi:hypothetical protein